MKTLKTSLLLLFAATILTVNSCTKEEDNSPKGAYSNGIFIVNEGVFQSGTGTITFFQPDSNLVKQNIFELVNGRPLGNIAQSMTIYNGKGYIVINNAGKVEVVDIATFKSKGTITGLVNPCQFLPLDNTKAYVSDWAGNVAVVLLNSNSVSKTIHAGTGPDAMITSGKYVYVANTGGFGIDSTITVIDFSTDLVVKTIQVAKAPAGLVADNEGNIWVICKGKGYNGYPAPDDTPGQLLSINPVSLEAETVYTFPSGAIHPEKLVINKEKSTIYFLYNEGIYRFNINSENSLPERIVSRSFYSLGYENKTGYLYASEVKSYDSEGMVFRFKANDGALIDSLQAGIIPRGFTFPEY